jgi:hypothetical protein
MSLHCSFEHLKHKLWPKERPGVKLAIWLPTTKVGNRPNLLVCKGCATYCWKALDESYNFASYRISIEALLTKLWGSKIAGVPTWAISGLALGTKRPFGCELRGQAQSILEGGRWWLSPTSGRGESCVSMLPVARPSTKSVPTMH